MPSTIPNRKDSDQEVGTDLDTCLVWESDIRVSARRRNLLASALLDSQKVGLFGAFLANILPLRVGQKVCPKSGPLHQRAKQGILWHHDKGELFWKGPPIWRVHLDWNYFEFWGGGWAAKDWRPDFGDKVENLENVQEKPWENENKNGPQWGIINQDGLKWVKIGGIKQIGILAIQIDSTNRKEYTQ